MALGLLIALLAWPMAAQTTPSPVASPATTAPIPDDAIRVCERCAFRSIQDAVDAAPDGATVVVASGSESYGPVHITRPVRLVGEGEPVIDAGGNGHVVLIEANNVVLEGFAIRNTGRSFNHEDSGVYVEGEHVRVLNNRIDDALFGINAANAHDIEIAGNVVRGQAEVEEGLRGDAIKVWWSHRAQIHDNHVMRSRDLLVWYSNRVDVYDNLVENSRYGFHFMNSDDGRAWHNQVVDNSVGIYLMYGKRFQITDNLIQGSRGPSGHGIGLKEVDGMVITGNVIYDNRIGIYIDNSPLSLTEYGEYHNNLLAYNDAALGILPSSRNNRFSENAFVENLEHVAILGGGKLSVNNDWSENGRGNFWSDYSGYDADANGVGDVPYRSERLAERLMTQHPDLQLFRFSIAETAVDIGAEAVPLFRREPLLVDDAPLMQPVLPTNAPPMVRTGNMATVRLTSVALVITAAAILWWGGRTARSSRRMLDDNYHREPAA